MMAFPTISPGLWKNKTTKLLSDAGAPLTSTFLMALVTGMSLWPFPES